MRSTISLPDRVRGLAAERHLTQESLADMLGLTRPAVRRRLKGITEFTASDLEKLARGFGVSVGFIFGETSHDDRPRPADPTAMATPAVSITSSEDAASGSGARTLGTTEAPREGA